MTYALATLAGFIGGCLFGILAFDWYLRRDRDRQLREMYERIAADAAKVHPFTIAQQRRHLEGSGKVIPIRDLDDGPA
jgi:hypothetical protein